MAKGKKSPQKPPGSTTPSESQAAEALTVAWSLAVVTVFLCDIGAALALLFAINVPEHQAPMAGLFSGLLLFAAAIIGLIVLIMLPIVYRVRNEPPPRGFTIFAVIVAIAPFLMMLAQMLRA